jgi:GT2 family glycosyltransferase
MDDGYFLYHEDTELSLRCWLAGLRVVYCPDAVAAHDYAFHKNSEKMHLLERNRLRTVLTIYPRGLLARVLPMLLITEFLMLALACARGFGQEKARSWWWLVVNARTIARRRKVVQAEAKVEWPTLASVLEPRIRQAVTGAPIGMRMLNSVLATYWCAVTRRTLSEGLMR